MAVKKLSKEEAIKYRQQGLSHQQIAEVMQCSKVWVSKAVNGVPKGIDRVYVDDTRIKAIAILTEALRKVKAL